MNYNNVICSDKGLITPSVYTDEKIFREEMKKVFGKTWLFVAHESQIPNVGDFVTTYMGLDPVIVSRQPDRSVKVFLNACRHRGARVVREDFGNSRRFVCKYHGWCYNGNGRLMSMPCAEVYEDNLNKEEHGLLEVAQVGDYKGLIFATFNSDAVALVDYLAGISYFLDASVDRQEGGIEFIGGINKWRVKANWKLAAEQFSSDMYHVYTTHKSPYEVLRHDDSHAGLEGEIKGRQFTTTFGHGFGYWPGMEAGKGDMSILPKLLQDYFIGGYEEVSKRLGAERPVMESHGTVFPNFSWLYSCVPTMRVWHPKGPDEMEVWSYTFVDANAPEEVKDALRAFTALTFGPSGVFEQDDGENWVNIQANLQSPRVQEMRFNLQMGINLPEEKSVDGTGTFGFVLNEMASRSFFQRWLELMSLN